MYARSRTDLECVNKNIGICRCHVAVKGKPTSYLVEER